MGSRGGAVVRALASHQCGPGSNPGVDAICGLSLLLVLSLAPRGFSPGTPVFSSPQKPTFSNSNSTRNQVDEEPLCGCATFKSLFILFIYYLFNVTKFLLYLHFLTGNCTVMKPMTSRTHSVRDTKKGRSGRRGDHTSYCYLITSPSSVEASL